MQSIYEFQSGKLYQHNREKPMSVMDYSYNKKPSLKKSVAKIEKDTPFFVISKIIWIPNANDDRPKNNEENIFTLQVLTDQGVKGFISLYFQDLNLFSQTSLTP